METSMNTLSFCSLCEEEITFNYSHEIGSKIVCHSCFWNEFDTLSLSDEITIDDLNVIFNSNDEPLGYYMPDLTTLCK